MKRIEKDELYHHLSGFLTTKGIEFKDGSYTKRVQQGCSILADLINMSQNGFEKAKTKADESLDRLRQVIHEKTAPKPPPAQPAPSASATAEEPPPSKPKAAAPNAESTADSKAPGGSAPRKKPAARKKTKKSD